MCAARLASIFLTLLLFAAACKPTYDEQLAALKKHMSGNQIGAGADYWLVKTSFGIDDPVILVYGYLDDFAACAELIEILNARYPSAGYRCRPAN